jgi:hypothetical protein
MMWMPLRVAVDELAHAGVPALRLVAEVNASFQEADAW